MFIKLQKYNEFFSKYQFIYLKKIKNNLMRKSSMTIAVAQLHLMCRNITLNILILLLTGYK